MSDLQTKRTHYEIVEVPRDVLPLVAGLSFDELMADERLTYRPAKAAYPGNNEDKYESGVAYLRRADANEFPGESCGVPCLYFQGWTA